MAERVDPQAVLERVAEKVRVDEMVTAAARAIAKEHGLDLDNLAEHADPGDTPSDLEAWRQNLLVFGRAAYEAVAPMIEQWARATEARRVREQVAQEIEVATGLRCPMCQGKPATTSHNVHGTYRRCGGGHEWVTPGVKEMPHGARVATVARGGGSGS